MTNLDPNRYPQRDHLAEGADHGRLPDAQPGTESGNFRQMTPDELEANELPRDFHERRPNAPYTGGTQPGYAQPAARRAGKTSKLQELKTMHERKKWVVPAALAAVVFLLGLGIGSSGEPQTIVETKEVEKVVDRPVEKRVEVPVTPEACVDALGYAQDVITSAGTTIGAMADGFEAASRMDVRGVEAVSPVVDTQTGIIKGLTPKFQSTRDECLAAAK